MPRDKRESEKKPVEVKVEIKDVKELAAEGGHERLHDSLHNNEHRRG